ncbi:hypothetical protein F4X86_00375 [Candidatus Saccharibacteria bacterium]|nr:hypothetical protein [Candidatus Saccharibacteria bacterium]
MNRRRSKTSPISKVVFFLVMGCLALIAFGAYVYVQDSKDSDTPSVGNERANLPVEPEENEGGEEVTDDQAAGQKLEEFDDKVASGVKEGLSEEMTGRTGDGEEPDDTQPPIIDISFSTFNESRNAFSTGLVIVNDQDNRVASCSLTIEAQTGRVSARADSVSGQHGASGCRFDNISLAGLSAPSKTEPWKITIRGNNTDNQAVVTLEKDLESASDLNNLINSNSGVSYVF